jgi:hypothetical protein
MPGTGRACRPVQRPMRKLLLVLLAAVALAGCAQSSAAVGDPGGSGRAKDSGIRGTVLLGPQCPVEMANSPCPDKPLEADIDVKAPSGRVVAHIRSNANGEFQVALHPGRYVLEPRPPTKSGFPFGKPVDVTVRPHRFTTVTVSFDTGIR